MRWWPLVFLPFAAAFAATPRGCTGSVSLGSFKLSVSPLVRGDLLPVKSVAAIPAGSKLIWDPIRLPAQSSKGAEVAAALLPVTDGEFILLEPHKAGQRAEWNVPKSPGVIALVYGPQGLSAGKVKKLVSSDKQLLSDMANYAAQTSEVEALVQELADSEASGGEANAALAGFSAKYGVTVPRLNTKTPTDQQAGTLLSAVVPTANAYDPLAPSSAQAQQSGSLAASVAGLFFGSSPAGLAVGGVALLNDLRMTMFPGSEFRSAFAQAGDGDGLTLCTKSAALKARTHIVYLWAYRVPNDQPPVVALTGLEHVPVGSKSDVKLTGAASGVKELARARDWKLVPVSSGTPVGVPVTLAKAPDSIEIDLSKVKAAPGDYRLTAAWDWDSLSIGTLRVHPYGDLSHIQFAPGSGDKLIEGSGTVSVKLTGADFEFLEKAEIEKGAAEKKAATPAASKNAAAGSKTAPRDAPFTLPLGSRDGEQKSIEVDIDTSARGAYRLALMQTDGVKHEAPFTVLPPDPKISNLPVRVNLGEDGQAIRLEGAGLERIESVSTAAGTLTGAAARHGWSGEIRLKSGLTKGATFPLALKVSGLESTLTVADGIEVVGPRPKIASVRTSTPVNLGIEVHPDELPTGTTVGLALRVENFRGSEGSQSAVELGCAGGGLRAALKLAPDEQAAGATMTLAGPENLFLSLDPGKVGYPGCRLTATVVSAPEGRSEAHVLGTVIRIPRLEQLTLTNEKSGDSNFAGILKGSGLDIVERVGWDARNGVPVDAIPTPIAGGPSEETLRVALPWPAPAPHAPLFIWLRGEEKGRQTSVTF
jgi:hypothetical protein